MRPLYLMGFEVLEFKARDSNISREPIANARGIERYIQDISTRRVIKVRI
jgi:hypothetical protein